VVVDASAYKNGDADGEQAGSKVQDALPRGGAKETAKGATEEDVVRAGEGWRVDEIDVLELRAQDHQHDANEKDRDAGVQGDPDEGPQTLDAVDDKRPDEVELLLDLKGPEVVDVKGAKDEGVGVPESQICDVRQVEVLPPRPNEMKRAGEEKQKKEDAVVEGKDAERAADVEGFEEVGLMERVQKDAGDEKAGEDKEEVDP